MKLFWQRYGYWIKLAISLVLLLFLLFTIDFESVLFYVTKLPVWFFVAAAFLHAIILFVATLRWWLLIPGESIQRLLRISFGTQHFVFLLPSSLTTDAIRLVATKNDNGGIGRSLAVIIWDKLFGLAALLILMGFSTLLLVDDLKFFNRESLFFSGVFAGGLGVLAVLLVSTKIGSKMIVALLDMCTRLLPISYVRSRKVFDLIKVELIDSTGMTVGNVFSFVLAILYQFLVGSGYILVASVFNQQMTWPQAIWASTAMQLFMMLPLGIAGIGLKDISLLFVLTNFGFAPEQAVAASLSSYPIVVLYALCGWAISVSRGITEHDIQIKSNR